ncbi:dsDNA nuclease domain-containing protein [Priestia megaterium]|uniref:dsDNA nuclease domain-containing protein n=1 Tax=Priestia megaterium TaxID=1404 RepID=UPI00336B72E8
MKNILDKPLREKAGSDSYNRYEYQVGWTVHHMLKKYEKQQEFIIFCEFHDDMAESKNSPTADYMEFYQIKTKSKGNFTFRNLFDKPPKKTHSFMGYIFYNFQNFDKSCNKCYFIGNKPFDTEIMTWQSIIQDEKILLDKDPDLYYKIKNILQAEYTVDGLVEKDFDIYFNIFIQNTFIYTSELPLEEHSTQLKGIFFDALKFRSIQLDSAHLIFDTLLNEVRKKTKSIIDTPISFEQLKEKKGISSKIFNQLENFKNDSTKQDIKNEISSYLESEGYKKPKIKLLLRELNDHYEKNLDISNNYYVDLIYKYKMICLIVINDNTDQIEDLAFLVKAIKEAIKRFLGEFSHPYINANKLEAIFYETLLSE